MDKVQKPDSFKYYFLIYACGLSSDFYIGLNMLLT
jgi:hypothetical protein